MSDLFRQDVIEERRHRLQGQVILQLSWATRLLVVVLVLVMIVAGVWVATAEYARTQTVRGLLVTSNPSVKIYAQRGGRVQKFALNEGQQVDAGQVLAIIDTDVVTERGASTATSFAGSVDARLQLASRQSEISQMSAATERMRLLGQIASLNRQIDGLRNQIALQREIVTSNRMMFERVNEVVGRGFISQFDYERRRQNLLTSEQEMSNLQGQIERLEAERAMSEADLPRLKMVMQRELSDIDRSVAELAVERTRYESDRSYVIRAPFTGRVTAIETAQGRYATGQTPLFVLMPIGSQLRARLYAPTAAIGMVETGQETTLLLDAFPYQRFGSARGEIAVVSRTILDPRDADVPFQIDEPVYQLDVTLEKQSMQAFGKDVPLQPGMTLTANIVLERQTFLDWLLKPLNAVLNRS